jgi:hypothetical protein
MRPMSSAILYLAIVAIWACVLIPRWLRRDSAHSAVSAVSTSAQTAAPDGSADGSADGFVAPAEVIEGAGFGEAGFGEAGFGEAGFADADVVSETVVVVTVSSGGADEAPQPLPAPLSADESRRRMLTARRRLLAMLVTLEAAAIALAVIGLAATWVVVPPTVMLAGYLLLLREAGHADAEQGAREAEAAAARAARGRGRAQALAKSRREARERTAQQPTPVEGTPLAARFAAAPVPADYEDAGRDFAPGLAGKYTTSNADPELADEDQYYEAPRLRAVGD